MINKDESAPREARKALAKAIRENAEYCECVRGMIDLLYAKFSDLAEAAPPNIDGAILRHNIDKLHEYMETINNILDGSIKEISVTEKAKLSGALLDLLVTINNSFHFAGSAVRYQKKREKTQLLVSKAEKMREKKALKSKLIDEAIHKHACIYLNDRATKASPASIAQAIEKPVAVDLAKDGVSPIKASAIAERIRKTGGVSSYKT